MFLQFFDLIPVAFVSVLFSLTFQLVTLQVDFDASKRALVQLKQLELVDKKEHEGIQKMLKAPDLTYVVSVVSSVINLLRIVLMFSDRQNGRRR